MARCLLCTTILLLFLTTAACGNNANPPSDNNVDKNNPKIERCPTGEVEVELDGQTQCKVNCDNNAAICAASESCVSRGSFDVCLPSPCLAGEVSVKEGQNLVCKKDCASDSSVCGDGQTCKPFMGKMICAQTCPDAQVPLEVDGKIVCKIDCTQDETICKAEEICESTPGGEKSACIVACPSGQVYVVDDNGQGSCKNNCTESRTVCAFDEGCNTFGDVFVCEPFCEEDEVFLGRGSSQPCARDCTDDVSACAHHQRCQDTGNGSACFNACREDYVFDMAANRCYQNCEMDPAICDSGSVCEASGTTRGCVRKCAFGEAYVFTGTDFECLLECDPHQLSQFVCPSDESCRLFNATDLYICQPITICTGPDAPARCNEPTTFTGWSPASIISTFDIVDPNTTSCCTDFNGDNQPDNALGDILSLTSELSNFNTNTEMAINDGSFALVMEYDGIDLNMNDSVYDLYFMEGESQSMSRMPAADGSSTFQIHGRSFFQGVYPLHVSPGNKNGLDFSANPSSFVMAFHGLGLKQRLPVTNVYLTASQDAGFPGAVFLNNGRMGGIISVKDLLDGMNQDFGAACGCLTKNGQPVQGALVTFDPNRLGEASCQMDLSASACDMNDPQQARCDGFVNDTCAMVSLFADIAPDISMTNLGLDCLDPNVNLQCDAISFGANFTAYGATIVGVVP